MKTQDELYIFVHLPKTAGFALKTNIENALLQKKFICTNFNHSRPYFNLNSQKTEFYSGKKNFINYINALTALQKQEIECIGGHDSYFGIHNLFSKNPRYIAFFRNPILRTISLYNYERMIWDIYSSKSNKLDTAEMQFLNRSKENFLINGCVPDFSDWLIHSYDKKIPFYFTMTKYLKHLGFLEGDINKNSITLSLDKFNFVGITEQYEENSLYLYGMLAVDQFFANDNASPPHISLEKLTPQLIEKIREINYFDTILYECAKQKNKQFKLENKHFHAVVKKTETIKSNNFILPKTNTISHFTGERFVPGVIGEIECKHLHRYLFAIEFCKNKVVLDIASGEGYGAFMLAQKAEKVIGVELDHETVAQANQLYSSSKIEFKQGSCQKIPLEDHSVDVITSFETLEHFAEHHEFLKEIKRVLRLDGVLILSTPDKEVFSDGKPSQNPYHVKELTLIELAHLMSGYFKKQHFFGQKYFTVSAIQSMNYDFSSYIEPRQNLYFTDSGSGRVRASDSPYRMTNAVLIASDVDIPNALLKSSFFELKISPSDFEEPVPDLNVPNIEWAYRVTRLKNKLQKYPVIYKMVSVQIRIMRKILRKR